MKVVFKNVDRSKALKGFIDRKSARLKKYLRGADHMEMIVDKDKNVFSPRLNISVKGQKLSLRSQADNAFAAVSELIHKANVLLSRKHQHALIPPR